MGVDQKARPETPKCQNGPPFGDPFTKHPELDDRDYLELPSGSECARKLSWITCECSKKPVRLDVQFEYCEDTHVCLMDPIRYPTRTPLCGAHRENWLKYGAYDRVSAARYLHNLEHGGVVLLYDPCLPPARIERLLSFIAGIEEPVGTAVRFVAAPYNLTVAFKVITFAHSFESNCFVESEVRDFLKQTLYKDAPEPTVAVDGRFSRFYSKRQPIAVFDGESECSFDRLSGASAVRAALLVPLLLALLLLT